MRGIEASYLWRGRRTSRQRERGAVVVEGETLRRGRRRRRAARALPRGGLGSATRASSCRASWNARVSLELSALRGELAGGRGYGAYLAELTEARERLAPERDAEAIEAAVSELVRFGTAVVGEVTRTLAALESLASAPLVARVFSEIAGLRRETATVVRDGRGAGRGALLASRTSISAGAAGHGWVSIREPSPRSSRAWSSQCRCLS
ncbi:MAG: hypothetical protein M5U28_03715 [Sandaracinaceae bacterium]|nr:hypothetical protein [Sandaracinaceae bacterium]